MSQLWNMADASFISGIEEALKGHFIITIIYQREVRGLELKMTYRQSCSIRKQWLEVYVEKRGRLRGMVERIHCIPSRHYLFVFLFLTSRVFKLLVHICLWLFLPVTAMWSLPIEPPKFLSLMPSETAFLWWIFTVPFLQGASAT